MSAVKQSLTPVERLIAAHAHFVLGIEQQHIAHMMVVNSGRVNEACKGIWEAMQDPKGVRVPAQLQIQPAATPEAPRPAPEPVQPFLPWADEADNPLATFVQ